MIKAILKEKAKKKKKPTGLLETGRAVSEL
jgi:hypothetical protein